MEQENLENQDEYSALSEDEAQEIIDRFNQYEDGDVRKDGYKDKDLLRFVLGMRIAINADSEIHQEMRPEMDYQLSSKKILELFWIDLIKDIPLKKAIRRDPVINDYCGDNIFYANFHKEALKNKANSGQELNENEQKEYSALGNGNTVMEGIAFELARLDTKLRKLYAKANKPFPEEQKDMLERVKAKANEEYEAIKDQIPEE